MEVIYGNADTVVCELRIYYDQTIGDISHF